MQTATGLFVEHIHVLRQVLDQGLAVGQALSGLTQAVELQRDAVQAQGLPQVTRDQDQLGVHIGAGKTQSLGAELVELPVTPALGALVAEHRTHVVQALATVVNQGMLDRGAHHTGGVLGAQGELFTVQTIGEGVHLFFNDVGDLTQAAHEERRGLHDGRAQVAVTVALHEGAQLFLEPLPMRGGLGGDVVHAFDGGDFLGHVLC